MNPYLAKLTRTLPLLIAGFSLLIIWQRQAADLDWRIQVPDAAPASDSQAAEFHSDFISSATDLFVHAASVTSLDDGRLLSAWFGGSREGARDVKIYGAFYNPRQKQWADNIVLASLEGTREALGRTIRKLGNPVVSQAPDGKLWLFYVSVSLGGWAGSAINASHSVDGGVHWSPPQRLISSPFANISTLVKAGPIYYQDGSIGLPVYHEFLGKFAELLRLDAHGRVRDKIRISHGKHSLQPVIVATNSDNATALMRYAGSAPKRLLASHSQDGGNSWPVPHKTSLPNPNSALSALRLSDGSILGVMNDLEDGRHQLSLMRSRDEGENWQLLKRLEGREKIQGKLLPREQYTGLLEKDFIDSAGPEREPLWQSYRTQLNRRVCKDDACRFIYDYPFMIQAQDGEFHIVYTWNKSFIKHLRFNQALLDTLQ
jgi:predicted neuraminidase